MRVVRVKEQLGGVTGDVIRLHHITDLHVGAPDFDEDAFLYRRSLIESDPQARFTMGGDGGDLIFHRDRRYSPTELHPRYRLATDVRTAGKEHLVELFRPIADKCIGWADGNHERAMDDHNGGKFGVEVCCALGVEHCYVGYRGFTSISAHLTKTQNMSVLIDLQHGWQSGRLKGAPVVQAEREFSTTDADIVLRGHNHAPAAHTFVTLGVSKGGNGSPGQVTRRYRTMINGGTWRRGYRDDLSPIDPERISEVEGDLWGETKGFRSEPIGGPVLILRFQRNNGGRQENKVNTVLSVEHTTIEGVIDARSLGLSGE